MDFFTVPTLTGRVLFVLIVLAHHRRRIVHLTITDHPTAAWSAQQVVEAFPDDTAPRWMHRDRDRIYGDVFQRRLAGMGIAEVVSAPASPWQNPYAERLIGSVRRECLNHVIVLGERHLRRILSAYLLYYHGARTHLSLEKDAPTPRRVHVPVEGRVVAFAEVGGLHPSLRTTRSLKFSIDQRVGVDMSTSLDRGRACLVDRFPPIVFVRVALGTSRCAATVS